ncbi:MAG: hypothetical protein WCH07_08120 [Deltaproteobacteria bacterium]
MCPETKPRTILFATLAFFGMLLFICASFYSASKIPLPGRDEAHLVEMGHNFLDSKVQQASILTEDNGVFTKHFYYMGSVLQDVSYRVLGFRGPRIMAVTAFLISSMLCCLWLLKRGIEHKTAVFFSLVFLLHPLIMQSARTRLDAWTFIPCFAILSLITTAKALPDKNLPYRFFIIGILAASSLFVWPISFLFFFVYLYELLTIRKESPLIRLRLYSILIVLILGCVAGCFLFLTPVLGNLQEALQSFNSHRSVAYAPLTGRENLMLLIHCALSCLVRECLREPLFMILAATGIFVFIKNRDFNLVICASLSFLTAFASDLYIFRFLYLMPFLLLFAMYGFVALRNRIPMIAYAFLCLMLSCQLLSSIIIPATVTAMLKGRSHDRLTRKMESIVGRDKCVYSQTFQTYYVGRDLKWNNSRYFMENLIFDDKKHADLLDKVDYIVDSINPLPYFADEEGFSLYHILRDYAIYSARQEIKATNKSFFARMGTAFAGKPSSPEDQKKLEQKFSDAGFEKTHFIDMSTPISVYPLWQQWIVKRLGVNPDYDNFIIWTRKQKRETAFPG